MDELVDILDDYGNYTGHTCLKSEAHLKGLFHPTVHIWFYTNKGQILWQQRGAQKDTHPLLWDVSVAGHIGAGEDMAIAAVREVQEEIGLEILPSELHEIGFFKSVHKHSDTLIDKEFHHTFCCELKVSLHKLTKQETEVEDLKFIEIGTFEKRVEQNELEGFVPHDLSYYQVIVGALKKRL
ncbi:NUDIX hydrolase [Flagellimonas flava]|uniref:NUDIX domain-containing protein n=1 Tax=Flagellimonas flava TaxID=570519 RepID=A0A1M5I7Q7_9FLAO|nr:NUDIX domain-containing protein [Allomuricauda flava]SHG24292.1 NUDIX domain-containing protein [Allomuricauda flava]